MIDQMFKLTRKLKKAFPKGLVTIHLQVHQHYYTDAEEIIFSLYIREIEINEDYPSWEALEDDALWLIKKNSKHEHSDIVKEAEEIKDA